jgi:hypothetical protein
MILGRGPEAHRIALPHPQGERVGTQRKGRGLLAGAAPRKEVSE